MTLQQAVGELIQFVFYGFLWYCLARAFAKRMAGHFTRISNSRERDI